MTTLQSAVSSPIRFEKWQGVCFATALNVQDADTGETICSMVQGEGRNFGEAKKNMFEDCKEKGIFLTARTDK